MARISLSRNIRFVEALAFLSLVFRGLASATAGYASLPAPFMLVLVATVVLLVGGLISPTMRKVSWVVLLVCGLVSVTLQPFEAGLLWILAAAFAMFHDGWFSQRPLVITAVAGGAVVAAQGLALVLHPADVVPLGAGILVTDAALGFLIHTFRHDLLGTGAEPRPQLRLADYSLNEREIQVLHFVWGGRVAKEISYELGLSDSTIRKDLSSIYRKMGVIGIKELFVLSHSHHIVVEGKEEA